MGPRLLVCTNGTEEGQEALRFSLSLAQKLESPVSLLAVVEKPGLAGVVERFAAKWLTLFEEAGVPVELRSAAGHAEDVIPRISAGEKSLVVVGRLGRPLLQRWVSGKSFRHILDGVSAPLLYVPRSRWPVRRILVCTGGLEFASTLETLSIRLAMLLSAQITLLHIVEPNQMDYPLARQINQNWKTLAETDTPQGRNLRAGLKEAQAAGIAIEVKIRRGHVVHEILQEVKSSPYDMIGLGSPHSSASLRHLYLPNVTAEVAEGVNIPVLSVRFGADLFGYET